jgi:hypothetical protein
MDLKGEYLKYWDHLKIDNLVQKDNFIRFFLDVSTCVESCDEFRQCLAACGMK